MPSSSTTTQNLASHSVENLSLNRPPQHLREFQTHGSTPNNPIALP